MNKKYLLNSIIIISLLFAGTWFSRFQLMKVYYKQQWMKYSPEPTIKQHEKAFMEDRAILTKYDIFRPSAGTKDAGPFLNSKVHWEIGEIHHQGSLVLPMFVHKEMSKDWVNKKPLFKKMGLKFDWMKELHKYDYWNPEENSPAFPEGKQFFTYSFPIPTYRDLTTWAKLRLLYGKATGDMMSALKDVRQLIRLIWTNDYLVSSMVAVNMLKLESEVPHAGWEVVPTEVLMRAKRHFYGVGNVTDARLSDEMFDKMVGTEVGICPMIVEGLMSYVSMREMMKDELRHEYQRMEKVVEGTKGKCRGTVVHKMWADANWPTVMEDGQNAFAGIDKPISWVIGDVMSWGELKKDDGLKEVMGYYWGGMGSADYLGAYK